MDTDPRVEQVWFAGAHADIGGGYVIEDTRNAQCKYPDDITLDWMIRRVQFIAGGDFPLAPLESVLARTAERSHLVAPQHDPRRGLRCPTLLALKYLWNFHQRQRMFTSRITHPWEAPHQPLFAEPTRSLTLKQPGPHICSSRPRRL
ncbi:hypothetical protein FOM02_35025 [Bradyrhizobium sp. SEMIA]|nr:hypothetical protein FOM02_35025 [Bradyrhizobium sp. SEMIA]